MAAALAVEQCNESTELVKALWTSRLLFLLSHDLCHYDDRRPYYRALGDAMAA